MTGSEVNSSKHFVHFFLGSRALTRLKMFTLDLMQSILFCSATQCDEKVFEYTIVCTSD